MDDRSDFERRFVPDRLARYRAEADAAQAEEEAGAQRRARGSQRDHQQGWDAFVRGHIEVALAKYDNVIGQVIAAERKTYRRQLAN